MRQVGYREQAALRCEVSSKKTEEKRAERKATHPLLRRLRVVPSQPSFHPSVVLHLIRPPPSSTVISFSSVELHDGGEGGDSLDGFAESTNEGVEIRRVVSVSISNNLEGWMETRLIPYRHPESHLSLSSTYRRENELRRAGSLEDER